MQDDYTAYLGSPIIFFLVLGGGDCSALIHAPEKEFGGIKICLPWLSGLPRRSASLEPLFHKSLAQCGVSRRPILGS